MKMLKSFLCKYRIFKYSAYHLNNNGLYEEVVICFSRKLPQRLRTFPAESSPYADFLLVNLALNDASVLTKYSAFY